MDRSWYGTELGFDLAARRTVLEQATPGQPGDSRGTETQLGQDL